MKTIRSLIFTVIILFSCEEREVIKNPSLNIDIKNEVVVEVHQEPIVYEGYVDCTRAGVECGRPK